MARIERDLLIMIIRIQHIIVKIDMNAGLNPKQGPDPNHKNPELADQTLKVNIKSMIGSSLVQSQIQVQIDLTVVINIHIKEKVIRAIKKLIDL